jgi:hypothetical protein
VLLDLHLQTLIFSSKIVNLLPQGLYDLVFLPQTTKLNKKALTRYQTQHFAL